jgi:hypothetical protein
VLVPIVEVAQDGQKRREIWMRSLVRLHILNSCPHRIANGAESPSSDFAVKVRPLIGDGESKPAFIGGRLRRSLMDSYGVDKVVKGCPQVVETISDHQRPSLERRRFVDAQNKAVSGALRVCLWNDTIRASVCPGSDFILDGLSVFLSPS